jgi:hypothetical protein
VDLPVDEFHEDAVYFQRASNVSLGGAFLEKTLGHPKGTRVELDLRLPGGDAPLRLQAEVVYNPSFNGMGVRFVDMTEQQWALLTDYLLAQRGD